MAKNISPIELVLSRVKNWCGVQVKTDETVTKVYIREHLIGWFPAEDTLEAVLCGSIRKQTIEDPGALPPGVWLHDNNSTLIIDLTMPRGMEEAIRILLNVYIVSQSPQAQDWWLLEDRLAEDPTCEKIAEVVRKCREAEGRSAEAGA